MGFLANSVARIPAAGYEWYVTLLEDAWRDSITEEVRQDFDTLAQKTGPEVLVVRGLSPDVFSSSVLQAYGLEAEPRMPALLISDTSPSRVEQRRSLGKPVRTIVIPLRTRRNNAGEVQRVLNELVQALHDEDSFEALKRADKTKIESRWGWLRALELKPNFMGLGVNVNQILDEMLFESQ